METRLTRRHFVRMGLGALGATVLAACVPKAPTSAPEPTAAPATEPTAAPPPAADKQHNITFAWWTGGEAANKVFESAIDRFEQSHANYKVNRIAIPGTGDFTTKILTMYGSGNAPDAHGVPWGKVWSWAGKGVLLDLTPLADRDAEQVKWDDMWPAITDALRFPPKGKIVAMPRETFGLIIFSYNKTLFAEAGVETPDKAYDAGNWTWDTWADKAKALTKFGEDGRRQTMGTNFSGANYWTMQLAMPSYGLTLFSEDLKTVQIDDPKIVGWLNLLRRMTVDDRSLGKSDELQQFDWGSSGKLGIAQGGSWHLPNMRETWVGFEWDFLPPPKGTCCHANTPGNDFHGVNANSYADQEGGWELLKFLNSPEEDLWWALNMFGPPFRRSNAQAWTDKVKESLPKDGWKYIKDMMDQSVPWQAVAYIDEVATIIDGELNQAVSGERPVDEVVASVKAKADEAIAKFQSS